jgi:hypothetical protein
MKYNYQMTEIIGSGRIGFCKLFIYKSSRQYIANIQAAIVLNSYVDNNYPLVNCNITDHKITNNSNHNLS